MIKLNETPIITESEQTEENKKQSGEFLDGLDGAVNLNAEISLWWKINLALLIIF